MNALHYAVRSAVLLALVALPWEARSADWALLIGAEHYQKAAPLQFTVNDVRQLGDTLVRYGGYDATERVLQITDDGESASQQPLKATLEGALPEFLKKPQPGDSILVYFSGHGFRDKEGKLYLAPLDCDPADPVATGISAEWFRGQLEACQAAFKLLVIDSCHAGSEKGDEAAASIPAKDLGDLFRASAGVVTLASSTGDEKSQIWQYKQQSLFSYWLNQGLKGHADADLSGTVNVDELYQYVHDHVRQTAKVRFDRAQTPVRIVGSRVPGVPEVIRLRPQGLKQVVADMAEQIAGLMEERQIASLGVVEFANEGPAGEFLGAEFGLLGKYCAEQLERGLIQKSAGKFSVVDRNRLATALKEQRFSLVSFESSGSLQSLSKSVGGMPVLCKGSLSERRGQIVHLGCKVLETEGDKALGHVGGVARLNESEWAMLGRSVRVDPLDRMPMVPRPGQPPPPPISQTVIERADVRSQGAHPMRDPAFPYRVRMFVVTNPQEQDIDKRIVKEREPVFPGGGNECYVPVRVGEVYEVRVENKSGQTVLLRLLVDGLNTQLEIEKDTKGIETAIVGQRVNLDEAKHCELDPKARNAVLIQGVPTWAVRGFVAEKGPQGTVKQFTVVDGAQSLAARRQFTDQIGIITAAFYLPPGDARGPGFDAGEDLKEEIREAKHKQVGNLVAIVHLRYVDERALPVRGGGR
jgi:uncharacterized caspase-like protein